MAILISSLCNFAYYASLSNIIYSLILELCISTLKFEPSMNVFASTLAKFFYDDLSKIHCAASDLCMIVFDKSISIRNSILLEFVNILANVYSVKHIFRSYSIHHKNFTLGENSRKISAVLVCLINCIQSSVNNRSSIEPLPIPAKISGNAKENYIVELSGCYSYCNFFVFEFLKVIIEIILIIHAVNIFFKSK